MNVIILTHDVRVPGSLANFGNPCSFAVATRANQLPGKLTEGTWRIVRRDSWQHDERAVSALRQLGEQPGVELVDSTGLLGGSQYGVERRSIRTEPVPFGKGAAGAAKRKAMIAGTSRQVW